MTRQQVKTLNCLIVAPTAVKTWRWRRCRWRPIIWSNIERHQMIQHIFNQWIRCCTNGLANRDLGRQGPANQCQPNLRVRHTLILMLVVGVSTRVVRVDITSRCACPRLLAQEAAPPCIQPLEQRIREFLCKGQISGVPARHRMSCCVLM